MDQPKPLTTAKTFLPITDPVESRQQPKTQNAPGLMLTETASQEIRQIAISVNAANILTIGVGTVRSALTQTFQLATLRA
jgi:hypothetical protein